MSDDQPRPDAGAPEPPAFDLPPLPSLSDLASGNDGESFPPIGSSSLDDAMGIGSSDATRTHSDYETADSLHGDGNHGPVSLDERYGDSTMLARGGMGMVLSVRDRRLNRAVAMKLIRRDRTGDESVRARFLREAQVHAQLEHPNIVPVHDLVESDSRHTYFTMKLVRGQSLAALIKQTRRDVITGKGDAGFPLTDRLEVFRKVCDAIGFAHSRGVLHRDLKPDNVMVGEFGEVQVMDWGLARVSGVPDLPPGEPGQPGDMASSGTSSSTAIEITDSASGARSLDGAVMGTPPYMAPEQARGEKTLDHRADVYALGAILYELLTLKPAFEGTALGILHKVIHGKVTTPSRRVADDKDLASRNWRVAPELEAIVLKAMARKADDRYPSASALRADVGEFIAGNIVSAARYSWIKRLRRYLWANRVQVGAILLVLLMGAGGVIAAMASARQARDQVLTRLRGGLDSAVDDLARIESLTAAGDYDGAIALADGFDSRHGKALASLQQNEVVLADRPEWTARAADLQPTARRLLGDCLVKRLQQIVSALPHHDLLSVTDDQLASAEAAFRRFEPRLALGDLRSRLPVADLAYWMASVYAAQFGAEESRSGPYHVDSEARSNVAMWVARAWQVQPDSPAVGSCMLLLADLLMATCRSNEESHQLVRQYQAACYMNRDRDRWLQARGFVGLARALLALADPDSARDAVVALLQVLQPDGHPRPAVADPGDDVARAALLVEAADLLMLARRLCAPVWLPDGADGVCSLRDGLLCVADDRGATLQRLEMPAGAGLAPPQLVAAGRALGGNHGFGFQLLARRVDGKQPVALLEINEADAIIADPRRPRELAWYVGPGVRRVTSGDLQGDGELDLVFTQSDLDHRGREISDQYVVRTVTGNKVRDPYDGEGPRPGTDVVYRGREPLVAVADLDGEPGDEIIICDRRDLIVIQGETTARVTIGETSPQVIDTPGGKRIVVCGWQSDVDRARRALAGQPMRPLPRVFRFADGQLHEDAAAAWAISKEDQPLREGAGFADVPLDGGRRALMDEVDRGPHTVVRYLLHDGDPCRVDWPGVIYAGSACIELAPDVYLTGYGITRRLTDADLATLVDEPLLPSVEENTRRDPTVTLNRMLMWFGQPDAAVHNIEAWSESATGAAVAGPLLTESMKLTLLQGLLENGRIVEAVNMAAQIPIESRLVPHVLLVADESLRQGGVIDDVAGILDMWASNYRLTAGEREQFRSRLRRVQRIRSSLANHAIEAAGLRARFSTNINGVHEYSRLPVYDCWVTNEPALAKVTEDGWHMVTSGRDYGYSVAGDPDGWLSPFAGLPVVLTGDTVRMEIVFRINAIAYGAIPGIGLFAVRPNYVGEPASFAEEAMLTGDDQMVATLVGRRLRLQHDWFGPLGIERIFLSDDTTGELLAMVVRDAPPVNSEGNTVVVGVCGNESARSEVTIERVMLNGDVWLTNIDEAQYELLLPDFESLEISYAQRILHEGVPAAGGPPPDLDPRPGDHGPSVAGDLIGQLTAQEDREFLDNEIGMRAFDLLLPGTIKQRVDHFAASMDVMIYNLVFGHLRQPQWPLDVDGWITIGLATDRLRDINDDVMDRDPRRAAAERAQFRLALAWAAAYEKRDDRATRAAILAAAHEAITVSATASTVSETVALQLHLLAVAEWLEELGPLTDEQAAWKRAAMGATGHSDELLRTVLPTADEPPLQPVETLDAAYGMTGAAPILNQLRIWLDRRGEDARWIAARTGAGPQPLNAPRAADSGGTDEPEELAGRWLAFIKSGNPEDYARLVGKLERQLIHPGEPAWTYCQMLADVLEPTDDPPGNVECVIWMDNQYLLSFDWKGTADRSRGANLARAGWIAMLCCERGITADEAETVLETEFGDVDLAESGADMLEAIAPGSVVLRIEFIGGRWYLVPLWASERD